jgi:trans-aconitate 2-methyltransferase
MAWQPHTYLGFAGHRTRPAYELIARVPLSAPRLICDLGCGPGNSTAALAERWPEARLIGIDNSPEMLAAAKAEGPRHARWMLADVATWSPDEVPDVIFANATFQWVPGQEALLPRLLGLLAKGGVLAFQVPANHHGPPHSLIDEALADVGLAGRVQSAALSRHVLEAVAYYRLLVPLASHVDIWDTDYLQMLHGENPVLAWVKGTALVPVMAALSASESTRFLGRLAELLAAHYPPELGGNTLFPFRRRFIVACRV